MANETKYHEKKEYKDVDYSGKTIRNREFYKCKFIACDFEKTDLRTNSFEDCIFEACNFSMTEIEGVGFRNAQFRDCKILGVDFSRCNNFMFTFRFENCTLNYSTFFGKKLQSTHFIKCTLKEVDFTECNLTSAVFKESDLTDAKFSNTILEKTDFRSAANISIDPEYNKVKKAKFSIFQLDGLLHKYQLDIEYND